MRGRVVLIDDEQDLLRLLEVSLAGEGFEVARPVGVASLLDLH